MTDVYCTLSASCSHTKTDENKNIKIYAHFQSKKDYEFFTDGFSDELIGPFNKAINLLNYKNWYVDDCIEVDIIHKNKNPNLGYITFTK